MCDMQFILNMRRSPQMSETFTFDVVSVRSTHASADKLY